MKKLQFIVFIPVVLGLVLLGIGMATGSDIVYAGIGVLFGGSFSTALIVTAVVIIKALKDGGNSDSSMQPGASDRTDTADYEDDDVDKGSKDESEAEREVKQIIDINTSYGYDNKVANAKHQLSHASKVYKSSSRGAKIGGCLFVIAFIGCAFGGMILLSLEYTVAGLIVFFSAFALIIGSLIVVKIKEHTYMSENYDKADYNERFGTVKLCVMSSSSSTGSHSSRITSITYRIQFEVDGKLYTAYSHNYYSTGAVIPVLLHKTSNIAKIVESGSEYAHNADDYDDDSDTDDYDDYDSYGDAPEQEMLQEQREKEDKDMYRAGLAAALERRRQSLESAESRKPEKTDGETPTSEVTASDKAQNKANGETTKSKVTAHDRPQEKIEPEKTEPIGSGDASSKRKPNVGYKGINRKK